MYFLSPLSHPCPLSFCARRRCLSVLAVYRLSLLALCRKCVQNWRFRQKRCAHGIIDRHVECRAVPCRAVEINDNEPVRTSNELGARVVCVCVWRAIVPQIISSQPYGAFIIVVLASKGKRRKGPTARTVV